MDPKRRAKKNRKIHKFFIATACGSHYGLIAFDFHNRTFENCRKAGLLNKLLGKKKSASKNKIHPPSKETSPFWACCVERDLELEELDRFSELIEELEYCKKLIKLCQLKTSQ